MTGLDFITEPGYDEWQKLVAVFTDAKQSVTWVIATLIEFGQTKFGDKYTQALSNTYWSYGTLANMTYTIRNVPRHIRRPELSFWHHYEVASSKLTAEEKDAWLAAAIKNDWSKARLRFEISQAKALPDVKSEEGETHYAIPINVRSAVYLLLDWIDGKVNLSKEEVKRMVQEALKKSETNDGY